VVSLQNTTALGIYINKGTPNNANYSLMELKFLGVRVDLPLEKYRYALSLGGE